MKQVTNKIIPKSLDEVRELYNSKSHLTDEIINYIYYEVLNSFPAINDCYLIFCGTMQPFWNFKIENKKP